MSFLRSFKTCLFLMLSFSFLFLYGCSARDHNPAATTGLGVLHEPRAVDSDTPVLRMTAIVHCEDRPAEGAVTEFFKIFSNVTGAPAAIAQVVTAPIGLGSEVVGMDRSEGIITLTLDDPDDSEVEGIIEAWYKAIQNFEMSQSQCFVNSAAASPSPVNTE